MDADPAAPAVLARAPGGADRRFHVQHHPVHRPFRVEQVLRRAHLHIAAGGRTAPLPAARGWRPGRCCARADPGPVGAAIGDEAPSRRAGAARHPRAHTPPPAAGPRSRRVPAARGPSQSPWRRSGSRSRSRPAPGASRAVARRFAVHRDLLRLRLGLALAQHLPVASQFGIEAGGGGLRASCSERAWLCAALAASEGVSSTKASSWACSACPRPAGARPVATLPAQCHCSRALATGRCRAQGQARRRPARSGSAAARSSGRAGCPRWPRCCRHAPISDHRGRAMNHTISTRKERCPGP